MISRYLESAVSIFFQNHIFFRLLIQNAIDIKKVLIDEAALLVAEGRNFLILNRYC